LYAYRVIIVYYLNQHDVSSKASSSAFTFASGELGKLAVVSQGILHKCIQQLLEKKRGLSLSDQAEDLECLCQIMKTVGKRLDTPQAKVIDI